METRAAKKRRLIEEENKPNGRGRDRSDLPDDIAHHILSFLPTKSVARTSALSQKWRYLWASFPILDFYELSHGWMIKESKAREDYDEQVKRIVSSVLSHRHENSNIKVFRLEGYLKTQWFHDSIPLLVKHRVQELVLHIWFSPHAFDLPSVLECDSLRSLTLTGSFRYEPRTPRNLYRWQHPFWFSYVKGTSGLRKLHNLSLTGVDFSDGDLFSDSSFPFLEKLTIRSCVGKPHLEICCPNLKDLQVFSVSKLNSVDISGMRLETLKLTQCFGECCVNIFAPNLQTFYWSCNYFSGKCLIQSFPILRKADINYPLTVKGIKIHSTVNLFSAISQVQNLRLSFEIFEILSKRYFEFGGLPYSFINLKSLQIDTSWSKSHIPGIACLFKSSPVVHTLGIEIIKSYCAPGNNKWNINLLDNGHCTEEQFWDAQAQTLSPFLCHLKVVKIRVFQKMGHEGVISIARFLLEHGKNLTGPAPNFPEPETNPAETSASHPCRVHSLKLCPLLPKRIKGTRLSTEISAESPLPRMGSVNTPANPKTRATSHWGPDYILTSPHTIISPPHTLGRTRPSMGSVYTPANPKTRATSHWGLDYILTSPHTIISPLIRRDAPGNVWGLSTRRLIQRRDLTLGLATFSPALAWLHSH
ncbi:unnamed protein product [Prunus armeniaca]|uniref:F-box domain-containing protein n=1 Tax=Prunus armeniaca TaxID=36596 RepID=A0A6J5WSX8_PRUAR|nr:unnamed protein product [Prunus armeniaca]